MNSRDDILRLARQAGWSGVYSKPLFGITMREDEFVQFADLVAAEKEQQMIRDGWRKCAEGQKTTQYCGLLDAAVKAEREACAKVCDHIKNDIYNNSQEDTQPMAHAVANFCAAAIRARGEQEQPR